MCVFGERLKILREAKGIGQEALAKAIGVSKGVISLWEHNLREPKLSSIKALALFFNESADYLIGIVN